MKMIIFALSICLFVGCRMNNNPEQQKTLTVSHALSLELTPAQREVVRAMVEDAKSSKTKTGRYSSLREKIADASEKDVTYLPVYKLNIDKFCNLPTPGNLLNSLELVQDSMYFFVSKNGEILYTMFAQKWKQQWVIGGIVHGNTSGIYQKFGIQSPGASPVEDLMKDARRTDWKVFKFLFYTYFTYCMDGERYYYSMVGNKNMTSVEACEDICSFIDRLKEDEKTGESYYY